VEYVVHVLTMIAVFGMLAVSFNVVIGYAGLFSIAPAAFYGIGAYTSALLAVNFGWPFPASLLAAIVVGAVISLALAYASVRVSGEYLAIASFGFQVIVFSAFNNWDDITRGARGIRGIPGATLGTVVLDRNALLLLSWVALALTVSFVAWITSGSFGRVLRAVRENEIAARALGKDVTRAKVVAFGVASGGAAIAGAFFAHHLQYIDPTSFTFDTSMLVLSMVVIGGTGYLLGPLVGAAALTVLPEMLRLANLSGPLVGPTQQIAYAVVLLLILRFAPGGLASLTGRHAQ
jgi:ABC-type branched-subunit amino acid transport system permease subunit